MLELISLHIPKTAGTTFKSVLERVYPAEALLLDYADRVGNPSSQFRTDFAAWQHHNEETIRNLPATAHAVHGHFWLGKYAPFFPRAKKIVWLRDPARQLISAYHYWKATPLTDNPLKRLLHEKNLSVLEFARLKGLHSPVTELFLRGYGLDDFDFVGIQEYFQDDLDALCRLMGWPIIDAAVMNPTASAEYRGFVFDEEIMAEIRALNRADVDLYEEARRRRASRAV